MSLDQQLQDTHCLAGARIGHPLGYPAEAEAGRTLAFLNPSFQVHREQQTPAQPPPVAFVKAFE